MMTIAKTSAGIATTTRAGRSLPPRAGGRARPPDRDLERAGGSARSARWARSAARRRAAREDGGVPAMAQRPPNRRRRASYSASAASKSSREKSGHSVSVNTSSL